MKPPPFPSSDKDKPSKPNKKPIISPVDTTGSTDDDDVTGDNGYTQSFSSGESNQGPFNQGSANKDPFTQGGANKDPFNQGGANKEPFSQGGSNQGGNNQGSYNQGGSGSNSPFGQGASGPGAYNPGNSGAGNQGTSGEEDISYVDEDTGFGAKPTKGPGDDDE